MDVQGYPQPRQRRLASAYTFRTSLRQAHGAFASIFPSTAQAFCALLFVHRSPRQQSARSRRASCSGLSACIWGSIGYRNTPAIHHCMLLCPAINAKSRSLSTCFLRSYSCALSALLCMIPQSGKKQFRPGSVWPPGAAAPPPQPVMFCTGLTPP